jgi:hypothetical protein
MMDIDALEREVQNEIGWGHIMDVVFARLRAMDTALRQISSCDSRAPGDVVDIARLALGDGHARTQ